MPLSWNEIKTRASTFSKEWESESREDARLNRFGMPFLAYLALPAAALPALKNLLKSRTIKVALSICFGAANY